MLTNLFIERRKKYRHALQKYYKYIFNDHFIVAVGFVLVSLAVQYSLWLKQSPEKSFFIDSVWALLMALISTCLGHIALYMEEADPFFLLPLESHWKEYLKASFLKSLGFPLLIQSIGVGCSYPFLKLYAHFGRWEILGVWGLAVGLVLVRLLITYRRFQLGQKTFRSLFSLCYFVLSFGMFSWSLRASVVWPDIFVTFLVVLAWSQWQTLEQGVPYDWREMVAYERNRQDRISRLLSLFVDLPIKKRPIQRRKFLDALLCSPKEGGSVYYFLLQRIFWRGREVLFAWVRGGLLGGVLIFIFPKHWLTVLFAVVWTYLTTLQLFPLVKLAKGYSLLNLYPIGNGELERGVNLFLWQPVAFQVGGYACVLAYQQAFFLAGLFLCGSLGMLAFLKKVKLPRFLAR